MVPGCHWVIFHPLRCPLSAVTASSTPVTSLLLLPICIVHLLWWGSQINKPLELSPRTLQVRDSVCGGKSDCDIRAPPGSSHSRFTSKLSVLLGPMLPHSWGHLSLPERRPLHKQGVAVACFKFQRRRKTITCSISGWREQ